MRILVTGSEGFIGTHVCNHLESLGHDLIRVDMMEDRVHGDTGCPEDVLCWPVSNLPYHAVAEPDIVIHLAAQVGVADSMDDPFRYIQQNTLQTTQFYEDLKQYNNSLKRIVVASSMSIYGEPPRMMVDETVPADPASVYGLSKYDQEKLTTLMFPDRGVAARLFNVYGPGQALDNPYTGVIANFAKRLLSDKPPIVYEDGQQTRDFIFVTDVAEAIVALALADEPEHSVYNIATGNPNTIEGVAKTLAKALDKNIEPTITYEHRDGDIRHCVGSSRRLQNEFDWKPAYPFFQDGAQRYANWLLAKETLQTRLL